MKGPLTSLHTDILTSRIGLSRTSGLVGSLHGKYFPNLVIQCPELLIRKKKRRDAVLGLWSLGC